MEANWISVEERLPDYKERVLLLYKKGVGKNQQQVMTEGYFTDVAQDTADNCADSDTGNGVSTRKFWNDCGYGDTYFDYADRQIESLVAKSSKNKVTHWASLPTKPKN